MITAAAILLSAAIAIQDYRSGLVRSELLFLWLTISLFHAQFSPPLGAYISCIIFALFALRGSVGWGDVCFVAGATCWVPMNIYFIASALIFMALYWLLPRHHYGKPFIPALFFSLWLVWVFECV